MHLHVYLHAAHASWKLDVTWMQCYIVIVSTSHIKGEYAHIHFALCTCMYTEQRCVDTPQCNA